MADPRAQQTLPFQPPVQRTATPPEPEPAREVRVDQLTGLLFDEFARRDAMLSRSATTPRRRNAEPAP